MPKYSKRIRQLARSAHAHRHYWHYSGFALIESGRLVKSLNSLAIETKVPYPMLKSQSSVDLEEWNSEIRMYLRQFLPFEIEGDVNE